ncbi:Phage head-tail joining protein [compost metagenome]
MKRRITFQKSESHRDQTGQVIYEWADLATVWAEIRAISGRERMSSGALYSEATVRIWTRYRDGNDRKPHSVPLSKRPGAGLRHCGRNS